jgi:hypothetical protein
MPTWVLVQQLEVLNAECGKRYPAIGRPAIRKGFARNDRVEAELHRTTAPESHLRAEK